jgi:hypothetical protein
MCAFDSQFDYITYTADWHKFDNEKHGGVQSSSFPQINRYLRKIFENKQK